MKKLYIISLLLFIYVNGNSQTNNNWKLFPSKDSVKNDSTVTAQITSIDTVKDIKPGGTPGTVNVNKDARIDAVSLQMATPQDGVSVKIKGYRLQIVASNKKATVDAERAKFLAIHPEINTYSDYIQPNHKLKVGDFKTKLEAQKLQHDLQLTFPSALVISDLIELPEIK